MPWEAIPGAPSFLGTPDDSDYGRVNSYGLLNARMGLRGALGSSANWDVSAWANNALDKRYLAGGITGPTFGAYSLFPGTHGSGVSPPG